MEGQTPKRPDEEPHEHEAGARGGEAAFAGAYPTSHTGVAPAWAEAIVRWSPIWMGLLAAIGIYFVVNALGMAIAFSSLDATRTIGRDLLQSTAIVNGIAGLIALFVGGFLAGRLGVHVGLTSPVVQGTAVWALYLIAALVAGSFGMAALGLAGSNAIPAITDGGVTGKGATMADVRAALDGASVTAWLVLAGAVLGWLASIGGAKAGMNSVHHEAATTRRP